MGGLYWRRVWGTLLKVSEEDFDVDVQSTMNKIFVFFSNQEATNVSAYSFLTQLF